MQWESPHYDKWLSQTQETWSVQCDSAPNITISQNFRRQVLGNQGAVERTSAAITRTERLGVETENIGNEITAELG